MQRLQSVNKSPIISHFSETVAGAPTIRAFKQQGRFIQESEERVGRHLLCNYICDMSSRFIEIIIQFLSLWLVPLLLDDPSLGPVQFQAGILSFYRWLGVRVQFICNLAIFSIAVLTFATRQSLTPGLSALAITYAMTMIDGLSWTIRCHTATRTTTSH